MNCVHDQGGEFIGFQFQHMLQRNGIHSKPTTSKNPQANSICERMHQCIANTLHVLATLDIPDGIETVNNMLDTAIAHAVFAHCSSYSAAIQTTPGGLAFGRDMILNLPLITDLVLLQEH